MTGRWILLVLGLATTPLGCGDVTTELVVGPSTAGAGGACATGLCGGDAGPSKAGAGGAVRPQCTAHADCPVTAPICDPGTRACTACSADDDCRVDAPRCNGATGACVVCLENADCPPPACTAEHCRDSDLCDPARHRCVECVNDGHCETVGERCSPALGECAVPCTTVADCDPFAEPFCDAVIGFCVDCRTDDDCANDELCRNSECTGSAP